MKKLRKVLKKRRTSSQADPARSAIMLLVATQSLTAGVIASNFDTTRPAVSKYLQLLTDDVTRLSFFRWPFIILASKYRQIEGLGRKMTNGETRNIRQ